MDKTVNPILIHRFHRDLTAEELRIIRDGLEAVPGDDAGRKELWAQFERNEVTVFICRDTEGALAFFSFFELRTSPTEGKLFYVRATLSLVPTRTMIETTFPQLENFARQLDCKILVAKTARPGAVEKLLRMPGYKFHSNIGNEAVLRKVL